MNSRLDILFLTCGLDKSTLSRISEWHRINMVSETRTSKQLNKQTHKQIKQTNTQTNRANKHTKGWQIDAEQDQRVAQDKYGV